MVIYLKICLEEPFGIYSTSIFLKDGIFMWKTFNFLSSSFLILFTYSFPSFWMRVSTYVGDTKTKPNETKNPKTQQQLQIQQDKQTNKLHNKPWMSIEDLQRDAIKNDVANQA